MIQAKRKFEEPPKLPAGTLEVKVRPEPELVRFSADAAQKQRHRMILAVGLLLVALVVVIIKDRQVWFGSGNDGELIADADLPETSTPAVVTPSKTPEAAAPVINKIKVHRAEAAAKKEVKEPPPAVVASNRKVLPPLDIDVVAGDSHRTAKPVNNALRVELAPNPPAPAPAPAPQSQPAPATPTASTGQRVTMSADASRAVDRTVEPAYPVLAKQMKVQGAVVMQALIGADGLIQDLKVISGPGILSSAAREAVRQWRFKPYFENGKAVETQAKITVNFTISTF
jgi:TonB family protein